MGRFVVFNDDNKCFLFGYKVLEGNKIDSKSTTIRFDGNLCECTNIDGKKTLTKHLTPEG
jgi:hypothetical protein